MTRTFVSFIKSIKPSQRHRKSKSPSPSTKELVEEECVVCLETARCLTTSKCHHPICVDCLSPYINITHNSRMPCPCPASAICHEQFTIDDITPYVNEEQIYKIWLFQAVKQIETGMGMYCPNPNCSKPILWTKKRLRKSGGAGKCKNCHQPICMKCKTIYHQFMTYSPFLCVKLTQMFRISEASRGRADSE